MWCGSVAGSVFVLEMVPEFTFKHSYLYLLALLVGSIIYSVIMTIFIYLIMFIYNCEDLKPFDAIFLLDDPVNQCNVSGVVQFEKFEYQEMVQYLEQKTAVTHKGRSKLVKRFGMFWNQTLTVEEW